MPISSLDDMIRLTRKCHFIYLNEMREVILMAIILIANKHDDTAIYIRGFSLNELIDNQINNVFNILPAELHDYELDDEDRVHPMERTPKEAFRHQYILHLCYDILKDNQITGTSKQLLDAFCKNLVPDFCLTDISYPFITSENPVFINTLDNGDKEIIFIALPTFAIIFGRGHVNRFYVSNLSIDEVDNINRAVVKKNEYIISCTDNLDTSKIWS